MNPTPASLEEIRLTLIRLRQNPKTRNKFPRHLWEAIIRHTALHSVNEISQKLALDPFYLKYKILQLQKPAALAFQDISLPIPSPTPLVIELTSPSGLKVKIEGPLTQLDSLYQLFRS